MFACAKSATNPTDGMAIISFEKWMANNVPNAQKIDNIYIEYIDTTNRSTNDTTAQFKLNKSMLRMDYSGSGLNGTKFVCRSEEEARLLGSWATTTHYCDDYVVFSNGSATISEGLYYGLKNLQEGDSARIYMPAELGYKTSFGLNSAYNTSFSGYENYPVIMNVRLKNVVNDPVKFEYDSLARYAEKEWQLPAYDTIKKGMYIRFLYTNIGGYPIKKDSSVYVNFAQYFLEQDFLIETNMDSIKKLHPEGNKLNSNPIRITPGETGLGGIFQYGLTFMRKGEIAEFLITSEYAPDGNVGSPTSKPEILPYQPMKYWIKTFTDEEYKLLYK